MNRAEMNVRKTRPDDAGAIQAIHLAAFPTDAEARLVTALGREADPLISMVAEQDGGLVGHILFSPVSLDGCSAELMGLAPMAVLPARQRTGVGGELVQTGQEVCADAGVSGVVVLGHPDYYPRFGFRPAQAFGLECEYDVPPEAFMAMELKPGALQACKGVVRYHPAFKSV